jgi:translation initiation factor IF-2
MPQTIEAIDHARAAGCPIVVALNKSDLPTANPQQVLAQLQKLDLVPEDWGGKTIVVKVSAKTLKGIDELLDMLLLEAEVLELKANPTCQAQGTILEAKLTKGHGAVSTALVQRGALRVGDIVVAGPYFGHVRAMRNDLGKSVKEARPSFAVEILGLSGVPDAGEEFEVVKDEKTARELAEKRELDLRERQMKGLHPTEAWAASMNRM